MTPMRVFVWRCIDQCSDRYHSEGGVVVFAANEVRARELVNSQEGASIRDDEKPDEVRDVSDGQERVFVMPNAGCC